MGQKTSRFHRCLKGWRQLTLARTRRAVPAPVWEGNCNHLLVTYMGPSEILPFRMKDLVPPLAPLLPCWSIVVTASVECLPKLESATGQSSWTSAGFSGSTSSCPRSRREIRRIKSVISITLQQQDCSKRQPTLWELSGMTLYQTRQWSRHRSGAGFQNSTTCANTRSVESFEQSHKIQQEQSPGGRLPLPPSPTPRQAGNTRATCRGNVDRATACPALTNV